MYRSDCTNCVASYSRCGPRRPSCSCRTSLENLVLQALKDLFFARKYWNKSVVHLAIPKEAWFARRIIRLIDHPSRGIGRRAGDAAGPSRSAGARYHRQVSAGVASSLSARPTRARGLAIAQDTPDPGRRRRRGAARHTAGSARPRPPLRRQ